MYTIYMPRYHYYEHDANNTCIIYVTYIRVNIPKQLNNNLTYFDVYLCNVYIIKKY